MARTFINWQKPKTNWKSSVDSDGEYNGDYFNVGDYNRLVNNLNIIHSEVKSLYDIGSFVPPTTQSKGLMDYLYYYDIKRIVDKTHALNNVSINKKLDLFELNNTNTINADELNIIEKNIETIHENLGNQYESRRTLKFNLGTKEVF